MPTSRYVAAGRLARAAPMAIGAGIVVMMCGLIWLYVGFQHRNGLVSTEGAVVERLESYTKLYNSDNSPDRWDTVYYRIIEYAAADGTKVRFEDRSKRLRVDPMREPRSRRQVRVYYNPTNPKNGFTSTVSFDLQLMGAGFVSLIGVIVFLTSLANWREWKRMRPDELVEIPRQEWTDDSNPRRSI